MNTLSDGSLQVINDFNNMLHAGRMPCFEFELCNDDYLLVDIMIDDDGIQFSFDSNDFPVYFDGIINGYDNNNNYDIKWIDLDGFTLDEVLEFIYSNLNDGFIYPNNLQPLEED